MKKNLLQCITQWLLLKRFGTRETKTYTRRGAFRYSGNITEILITPGGAYFLEHRRVITELRSIPADAKPMILLTGPKHLKFCMFANIAFFEYLSNPDAQSG